MNDKNFDENKTTSYKRQCSKYINIIFSDLVEKRLIDPESAFFQKSKKYILNCCNYYLFPIAELFDDHSETNHNFFLHNSYLFAYSSFLDQSLDALKNNPSTEVRSFQISSYLLLSYFEWLTKMNNSQTIMPIFYGYYKEYTNYLILEKKWHSPELYILAYGSDREIYKKAFILFFPLDLLCKMSLIKPKHFTLLKKIFINYWSFVLLADDLIDLNDDISHRCLTYPIALHYKSTGHFPESQADIAPITSQVVRVLNSFQENINKFERDIGRHSLIIDNKISNIKNELKRVGIKL
ncbi:MAG: hypothetical protein KJ666_15315 [Bacteroidetes bacterium]|nr:hypothetical protein [Bacteroidota bacterium]MBU2584478.1 hypothetical protein [Bacteroidota bacterium]